MQPKIEEIRRVDEAQIVRELVERNGLHEFIRQFWPIIQPGTEFVDNWHIGAIAEFLEALSRRQIVNGVINIPPGHGKTKNVSVLWPMWTWTWQPQHRFLMGNYDDKFLVRDGRQCLDVLRSDLYRKAWPDVKLTHTAPAAKYFENTKGGLRFGSTPGGGATGEHGHTRACDDPMKAQDARSEKAKEAVINWWNGTMSSRRASGIVFASLIIMQRLASDDLAAKMLEAGYEHLMLPAEYVPGARWDMGCSLGKLDVRTEPGELLWPELKPKEQIEQDKRDIGNPASAQAQFQQNPVPDTGGIIERPWIKRWSADEKDEKRLPRPDLMRWLTSWDLGFDGEDQSHSRVAGGLWAACRVNNLPRYFLVQAFATHMNYPQTKQKMRELLGGIDPETKKRIKRPPLWEHANRHVIEKKANGTAILAELRNEIPGLESTNPVDSKGDRLLVHSDKFRAGEVWHPPEIVCPQIAELEDELVFFPNGEYDDFVDITTQALDKLGLPNAGFWAKLLQLAQKGASAGVFLQCLNDLYNLRPWAN